MLKMKAHSQPTRAVNFVMVQTTLPNRRAAAALARAVLEAQLAACVHMLPIRSMYWWRGKIESAAEILFIAKTRAALSGALTGFIKKQHPYEVPEIVITPIARTLPAYARWLTAATTIRHASASKR